MKSPNPFRALQACILVGVLAVLSACGGGGKTGSGAVGESPTATTVLNMSLELRDTNGDRTSVISVGQTVYAVARVTQTVTDTGPNGPYTSTRIAQNVAVMFQTTGASITPTSGSVLTDAEGKATATLVAGNGAGAFVLDASVDALNATGATAQIAYSVDRVLEPNVTLRILDAGGAITNTLRAGATYTIEARAEQILTDLAHPSSPGTPAPAADVILTFASDGGVFDPTNGQVLTDAAGVARANFQAAVLNGGFAMTVTGEIDERPVFVTQNYSVRLPNLRFGSGEPFQPGLLGTDPVQITAGGSVVISGELRDENDALFLPPVPVDFSSACSRNGAADISTPTLSSGGRVLTRYVAGAGCYGADEIRGAVVLDGSSVPIEATATIAIDPPIGSGIIFLDNEPDAIVVQGRGTMTTPESAVVTFQVTDPSGLPVPGAVVLFNLTNPIGEARLFPTTNTSGADGVVSTRLAAGRTTGNTSVLATVTSTGAQTQSAPITISNGRPTQNAFSLSAERLNIEAANIDGVQDAMQIRLADRNGNPAPDGINVRFTASGGAITPSCTITAGGCGIILTSQAPRPSGGRIALLATTAGDESFTDLNGNNLYDAGEPLQDLPEAFRDDNESYSFNPGEPFIDDNLNGVWNTGNALFDGADCASGCGRAAATLRATGLIVFSTSQANINIQPNNLTLPPGGSRGVTILVSDLRGNMMAGGTSIAIQTSNVTFNAESAYTVADTNAPGPFTIYGSITAQDTEGVGSISVKVTSPSGVVTNGFASVIIASGTGATASVSNVELTSDHFDLAPGEQRDVTLGIVATSGDPFKSAAAGVVPELICDGHESNLTARVRQIQPTRHDGTTLMKLRIEAGRTRGHALNCRIHVGAASASLIVRHNPGDG